MIECPDVSRRTISGHYDLSTPFYRLLWGRHIHHGLWQGDESPRRAQVQLTETLADLAGVQDGDSLLDVGCGMGGSTIHLARTRNCRATGVTISRLQRRWARTSAWLQGVRAETDFVHADAEQISWPRESFDVVWSIECTEHLYDKAEFFVRAAEWLKPGGRMAICAWLAGDGLERDDQRQQVYDVCEGFFCPSLGSAGDYLQWMQEAGLRIDEWHDWTTQVSRTWEICERRVRRFGIRWLARLVDKQTVLFLDRFQTILHAYQTGAMRYGAFVATLPDSSRSTRDCDTLSAN